MYYISNAPSEVPDSLISQIENFVESFLTISIIIIIAYLLSIILCPIIAGNKGRSVFGWLCGGIFLGVLGLLIVACLPNLRKDKVSNQSKQISQTYDIKIINSENKLQCKFCGQDLVNGLCLKCGAVGIEKRYERGEITFQERGYLLDKLNKM